MSTMTSRANRILLAAASALLLSCGSSSPGTGNAAAYVGTWTYSNGTLTPMNCTFLGQPIPPLDLTGDPVTISQGSDSTQIQFVQGTSCTVKFTVNGTVATALPNQSCTIMFDGQSAVLNVTSWTLTLSNATLAASFSGSAPIGGSSCTASGTGTLTHNGVDASTSPDASTD
jgi:hypothetical protein